MKESHSNEPISSGSIWTRDGDTYEVVALLSEDLCIRRLRTGAQIELSVETFLKKWLPADDLIMVPYSTWSRDSKTYKVLSVSDNTVEMVGCNGTKVYVGRKQLISLYKPKGRRLKLVTIWEHIHAAQRVHLLVRPDS